MENCQYCQSSRRTTSKIPYDAQAKCFKKRRGTCRACDKLDEIDRKIDGARRALEVFLDEREALTSIINEHHDPIIHYLPPEIVSRIFVCLKPVMPPPDKPYASYNEKETIRALFTPGKVCKDWRRIAQSTPKLWNVVCATITQSNGIPSVVMIQEWLERSGALPLSLQISIPQTPSKLVSQSARKIMAEVILHARRWESLDIDAPSDLSSWMLESLQNTNLDGLQCIKARSHCTAELRLPATPRLLTLSWGTFSHTFINCERLTHIAVDFLYVQEAMKLIRDAPYLVWCDCYRFTYGNEDTSLASPAFAPSLRYFGVTSASARVWNHLRFPSLETLRTYVWHRGEHELWPNLQAFLRRSGCSIRELELGKENPGYEQAILEVLKLTPDLERLSLKGPVVTALLFSLLDAATIAETKKLLPKFMGKLGSLSLTTHLPAYDWSSLIGFLSNMTSNPTRSLQSFDFEYMCREPEDLKKDTLQSLLDVVYGLNVKISGFYGEDLLEKWRHQHNM